MKLVLICGDFDDATGRASTYCSHLFRAINGALNDANDTTTRLGIINGGNYDELAQNMVSTKLWDADFLIWMPNIANDKEKLVSRIKEINEKVLLVISKNNMEGKYERLALIARALKAKANLMLEITRDNQRFAATIFDPLGNEFCSREESLPVVADRLIRRLFELESFTRIPSVRVGPENPYTQEQEFFELVREYAEKFHLLIHAANQSRLLGNVSFRCENGFPSYKDDQLIYVSRRNIDKRDISSTGFVAVRGDVTDQVQYYGDNKPSVDTPIQIRLYQYYPNVKYMLHAHVYVEGAPETASIVPCGAVEEFDEIVALYPDRNQADFAVNLRGHGSLVLTSSIEGMKNIPYIRRL